MYKKLFLLATIPTIFLSACMIKEEGDDAPIHSNLYYLHHFPKAVEVVNTCMQKGKENNKSQFCKDNLGNAFYAMMKYQQYNPRADIDKLTPENAPQHAY